MFLTHGQYIPGDMAIQQKIDIVDQSNSSIPRLVKESNGSIILHLQGHQRKLSYSSLESVVCQKGAKEEKAQNFRCIHI